MPDVRLVDLDVIKKYSVAVRVDAVPAEELLEALDASRAVVMAAMGGPKRARVSVAPRRAPAKVKAEVVETQSTRSRTRRSG